jgi:hypothetical protein
MAQLAALVHVGHWSPLETQMYKIAPPPKPPSPMPGTVQHVCLGALQKFPASPQGTKFEGMLGAPSGLEPPLEPALDPDELSA